MRAMAGPPSTWLVGCGVAELGSLAQAQYRILYHSQTFYYTRAPKASRVLRSRLV
jgi:hypothetical protein